MALAYSVVHRDAWGSLFMRLVDVTLDTDYAAGGYSLDSQEMGFGANGVVKYVFPSATGGYSTVWNPSTGKLEVYDASGDAGVATEVADGENGIATLVARVVAIGIGQG